MSAMLKRCVSMLAASLAILLCTVGVSTSARAQPYHPDDTISVSSTVVCGGCPLTISGTGRVPGETMTITIASAPRVLATTIVRPDGTWSVTVTMPTDLTCGTHTITATGSISGHRGDDPDADDSIQVNVTPPCVQPGVPAPPPAPAPPPSPPLAGTGVAVMGIGGLGLVLLIGGGVMLMLGRRRKA